MTGKEPWKEQPLCLILRWNHSWEEKELLVKWEHLKWNHGQKVQMNSAMWFFVVAFQKKTSYAKIYVFTCRNVFQWKFAFFSFTADYKSIKKKFKCWFSLPRTSSDSCFPARLQTIPSPFSVDDLFLHYVDSNNSNYFFNFSSELQKRFKYFAISFLLDSIIHFCQLCCQSNSV